MPVSTKGVAFIAAHEGFASKAYRCPAGVVTIGYGFTMGSKVVAAWWKAKHSRGLQMGDTITRGDADQLLLALLNSEYGAAVASKLGNLPQHQHDAASSTSFNCGTGALAWKWAVALKSRAVAEAAQLLRTTATTANGRQLAGLVRRRKEEAYLLETGSYGAVKAPAELSVSTQPVDVKWYQDALKKLGYAVTVDGKAASSDAVVRKFQTDHKLVVDGKVGPATRATLIRALDAKAAKNTSAGSGAAAGTAGAGSEAVVTDPAISDVALAAIGWGLVAAAVVALIFFLYRYRGQLFGRRVPT